MRALIVVLVAISVLTGACARGPEPGDPPPKSDAACVGKIKGNISTRTGERIYHLPGQRYYRQTDPERWFCTEEEAKKAGYRRSKV